MIRVIAEKESDDEDPQRKYRRVSIGSAGSREEYFVLEAEAQEVIMGDRDVPSVAYRKMDVCRNGWSQGKYRMCEIKDKGILQTLCEQILNRPR
jgi:hypothetical protein